MNEQLLDPLQYFNNIGKQAHEENIRNYFRGLAARSNVDEEQNQVLVYQYDRTGADANAAKKVLASKRISAGLCSAGLFLGLGAAAFGIYQLVQGGWPYVLPLAGGLAIAGCSGFPLFANILPDIQVAEEQLEGYASQGQQFLQKAMEQMGPLNALFRSQDALRLFEQTLPGFSFDPRFTNEQHALLKEHYDYTGPEDSDSSVTDTLSGRFNGNPFLFTTRKSTWLEQKTYSGSRTVHWTETETVTEYEEVEEIKNGKTVKKKVPRTVKKEVEKSEKLTAYIERPVPCYEYRTALGYGHHAAPALSFSRKPTHVEKMGPLQRQMTLAVGSRRLEAKKTKALKSGGSFQPMGNETFDVLFGAHDRSDEVQFRTLYTPLAQRNTLALMNATTGFGDDFHFQKTKRFNEIRCQHFKQPILPKPDFQSHSMAIASEKFRRFHAEYFKSLFFCFAPLLAVPAYLEAAPDRPETPHTFPGHFPTLEHEAVANAFPSTRTAHPKTETDVILKTELVSTTGTADIVKVTACSYETRRRCKTCSEQCENGKWYDVDVYWTEYLPLTHTVTIRVEAETEENTAAAEVRIHGLVGTIIPDNEGE